MHVALARLDSFSSLSVVLHEIFDEFFGSSVEHFEDFKKDSATVTLARLEPLYFQSFA